MRDRVLRWAKLMAPVWLDRVIAREVDLSFPENT